MASQLLLHRGDRTRAGASALHRLFFFFFGYVFCALSERRRGPLFFLARSLVQSPRPSLRAPLSSASAQQAPGDPTRAQAL